MTILVDSREKCPLEFCCDWKRKGMKVGDYGALFSPTYQHPIVWERKSIGDLYNSLTFSYDRFRRMFFKAEKLEFKVIIAIEGTKEKVLKGYDHSQRDPASIIKQLETIHNKYGVAHVFFSSRKAMANYIVDYYLKHYEEWKLIENNQKMEITEIRNYKIF